MKEYVCSVCGYIHKGDMPDDFKCPWCGAGKDAFKLKSDVTEPQADKPRDDESSIVSEPLNIHSDKELSPIEISVICSNLARGCEKQYMPEEQKKFLELADFFKSAAQKSVSANAVDDMLSAISEDLEVLYPNANAVCASAKDRGALRALVWSEKVTTMLDLLLKRYKKEGENMLVNTGVYLCTICGFIYIGDNLPDICPVCKVPSWKFDKIEGGT